VRPCPELVPAANDLPPPAADLHDRGRFPALTAQQDGATHRRPVPPASPLAWPREPSPTRPAAPPASPAEAPAEAPAGVARRGAPLVGVHGHHALFRPAVIRPLPGAPAPEHEARQISRQPFGKFRKGFPRTA